MAAEAYTRQLKQWRGDGVAAFRCHAVKAAVNGSINRSFFLTFFMLISVHKSSCRLVDLRTAPVYVWEGGWLKVV